MGENPAEKASRLAHATSEGLNCLGVFMCGPALRKCLGEAPDLLRRWESEYAPVFRQIDLLVVPDPDGPVSRDRRVRASRRRLPCASRRSGPIALPLLAGAPGLLHQRE